MRRVLPLALALLATGCGREVTLEAVVAAPCDDCACRDATWTVESIRVQVIEWQSGGASEPLDTRCFDVEEPSAIHDAWSMLEWFGDRGSIASAIPVDESTRVQLIGFTGPGCRLAEASVCAVDVEPMSASSHGEGDLVPISFVCQCTLDTCGDPTRPFFGRIWESNDLIFQQCLNLESLDDFGG